ncbi:MAG: RNA methyltransferase [FCB group bacterium]|jgi:tRNA (guanosine-2'-O-)-methyltransferase
MTHFRTDERYERTKNVLEKRQTTLTVVLENIDDPHNLSACLRSCDAVGILEVNVIYNAGQPFPKLGEKSSASSRKWVNIKRFDSVKECYNSLRGEDKKIYTTHLTKDAVSIYDLNLTEPVALVFGNEHSGVSDEAVELADGNFLIPQVGMIQSLNISVACAVSVYEAFRQRNNADIYNKPQLDENLLNQYLNEWLKK